MRRVKGRSFYKEPWYNSYRSMMDRCENPNAHNYNLYGGRGIEVCEDWHDIEKFEEWVKLSDYEKGLTLERIDVNGNYEPSNCTWATKKNKRIIAETQLMLLLMVLLKLYLNGLIFLESTEAH